MSPLRPWSDGPAVWADGKQCCAEHIILYNLYALAFLDTKEIPVPLYKKAPFIKFFKVLTNGFSID